MGLIPVKEYFFVLLYIYFGAGSREFLLSDYFGLAFFELGVQNYTIPL